MTDLEINKALATAIGWKATDSIYHHSKVEVWWHNPDAWEFEWRIFDYRDWNVIGPIAERYDCFPQKGRNIFGGDYWWACADEPYEAYEALHRVDAIERGMVTTKCHHYAAREETTNVITAIKEHLK